MTTVHSGVIEPKVKERLEQQVQHSLQTWLSSWYRGDRERVVNSLSFFYSQELFQAPEKWRQLTQNNWRKAAGIGYSAIFVDGLAEFELSLLNLQDCEELNERDLELVTKVCSQAKRELNALFVTAKEMTVEQLSPVAIAQVSLGSSQLCICITADYLQGLYKSADSSVSTSSMTISELCGTGSLTLDVQLTTASLTFNDLCSLKPGDVLSLEQPVQQALSITSGNQTIGQGYLVNKDGQKAVYLMEK